jgi:predicted secreted protein
VPTFNRNGLLPTTLLILALAACSGFWTKPPAQITFQRTYGGTNHDWGWSVVQTTDGGYVIAGATKSFGAGSYDVYLVKTDASGDTVWTRTYGGTDDDWGRSLAQTADGGYVITGYSESYGAGGCDVWLIRADASGDTIWTRTYGGTRDDYGYSVRQTADGGYVITGETWFYGVGFCDVWLIKTDASGDTMWTRTYGGTDYDRGESVLQTADGGYVITGETSSFGAGGSDVWLIKTDAAGDTMWTRTFGGAGNDYDESVAQTADGGYIIAGYTGSFSAGGLDAWLIKTDSAGNAPAIAEP